jgi:hypothetical protein
MHTPLATLMVLAAVGSCDPMQFKSPLSDPAKVRPDARLVGTWSGRDDRTDFVFFVEAREDQHLDLLLVGRSKSDGVAQIAWDGFPTSLGGKTYLNLREKHYSDMFANKFTLAETTSVVRYELTADTLAISYLPGESLGDAGVALETADSRAVAAAVQKLPPAAFKPFVSLKRFKVP